MSIRAIKVEEHEFKGVYWIHFEDGSSRLATINLTPGKRVYGEQLITMNGVEYRVWNPYRSKLAAALMNGLKDVIPILADARYPEQYVSIVKKVDLVYIDVAQPFQAKVLADNADVFLNKGGRVVLVIKAMSIDVTKEPSETFKREIDALKERGFEVETSVHLEPYDVAHALVVGRKI